ncbi:MAG TPA: RraA family protein [Clostridiales bacterium]|jgi:regulator of RNase E activity RraA|nr:RraA family protein [Clostridiales bacterium]
MGALTPELRERLYKLSTTNISDAMDALGFSNVCHGIVPLYESCKKIVGEAITQRFIPTDHLPKQKHGGMEAIQNAAPGSIIVVEGSVRTDMNTCGGIAATAASVNGLAGWVSDGLVRDVDEIVDLGFPVYCKGRTVLTTRGRFMEAAINEPICCGGALCRFGDIVVADKSGVVIIPQERLEEVTVKAEELAAREDAMIRSIKEGAALGDVDVKSNYENMLKN